MQLTGEQVENAFVETAREQESGEPFNWNRVALHLNERLADNLTGRSRFMLQRSPVGLDENGAKNLPTVGSDRTAKKDQAEGDDK